MSSECTTQIDIEGKRHLPQPTLEVNKFTRNIARIDRNLYTSLETTGFIEFEGFTEMSQGLIGIDLDLESEPNIKLIYSPHPWDNPESPIYYIEGNFGSRADIFQYSSNRISIRNRFEIERIYFSLMYPRKERTRLRKLSPDESLLLSQTPPLSLFLSLDYFYDNQSL